MRLRLIALSFLLSAAAPAAPTDLPALSANDAVLILLPEEFVTGRGFTSGFTDAARDAVAHQLTASGFRPIHSRFRTWSIARDEAQERGVDWMLRVAVADVSIAKKKSSLDVDLTWIAASDGKERRACRASGSVDTTLLPKEQKQPPKEPVRSSPPAAKEMISPQALEALWQALGPGLSNCIPKASPSASVEAPKLGLAVWPRHEEPEPVGADLIEPLTKLLDRAALIVRPSTAIAPAEAAISIGSLPASNSSGAEGIAIELVLSTPTARFAAGSVWCAWQDWGEGGSLLRARMLERAVANLYGAMARNGIALPKTAINTIPATGSFDSAIVDLELTPPTDPEVAVAAPHGWARLVIDVAGLVQSVSSADGVEIPSATAGALRRLRFTPGTRGGKPANFELLVAW